MQPLKKKSLVVACCGGYIYEIVAEEKSYSFVEF